MKKSREKNSVRNHESIDYRYQKFQSDRRHLSYETEQLWFDAIKKGDLALFQQNIQAYEASDVGTLAHNPDKQAEYQALICITLSTRAAIEGGISPDLAYEKSDLYVQELAICKKPSAMADIGGRAMLEFLQMVHSRKECTENGYVKQCKDYVTANYHKSFSIKDMAQAVGLNESYLCRIFKKSEGITLGEYIQQERIKIAKKMLKYNDTSIAEIADFLGYHSQSYFGKQFSKWTGMSPSQYRIQNKIVQALDDSED